MSGAPSGRDGGRRGGVSGGGGGAVVSGREVAAAADRGRCVVDLDGQEGRAQNLLSLQSGFQ